MTTLVEKKDIADTFKKIRISGIHLPAKIEKDETDAIQARGIIDLWYDLFKFTDKNVFKDATDHILQNCEFFPKPKDWFKAIDVCKPNGITPYSSDTFKYQEKKEMSAKAKMVFSYMKAGKVKELRAKLGDIPQSFKDRARDIFPDCTDKFIDNNYNELSQVIDAKQRCTNCSGLTSCKSEGFFETGYIDKSGYLRVVMNICANKAPLIKAEEARRRGKGSYERTN